MKTNLAGKLVDLFLLLGYTWKVNGKPIIPDERDFTETLDKARSELYTEPIPSQMEIGRLIIRHYAPGKYDVYIHVGSMLNAASSN